MKNQRYKVFELTGREMKNLIYKNISKLKNQDTKRLKHKKMESGSTTTKTKTKVILGRLCLQRHSLKD